MDKLDEQRLELVRRTANFAAIDAKRALRRAKLAILIGAFACVLAVYGLYGMMR